MIDEHAWDDYFTRLNRKQFASPDETGSEKLMDYDFLCWLQQLAVSCQTFFAVSSGYRTPIHNDEVGGSPNSSHMKGLAADIIVKGSLQRFLLVERSLRMGCKRIGVYRNMVHIDMDIDKPSMVLWNGLG